MPSLSLIIYLLQTFMSVIVSDGPTSSRMVLLVRLLTKIVKPGATQDTRSVA